MDASILPIGYLGIVAPMNSLGFALHPALALMYDEALVLLPAETLVFTFQQKKAADEALQLPYDQVAGRQGASIHRLDQFERVELIRPVLQYRLLVSLVGEEEQRWIIQKGDIPEIQRVLSETLGDRFVDDT